MDIRNLSLMQAINNYSNNHFHFLMNWISDRNDEECLLQLSVLLGTTMSHFRIGGYCEEWLPAYLEYDFFQLFRMTKTSFYILLGAIDCPEMNKNFTGGEVPIPGEKMLMMTLWWLGKGEVLLSVSDKFNVCLSAVHRSLELVLSKLVALKNKYISWPDNNELITIERDFQVQAGFPGLLLRYFSCS